MQYNETLLLACQQHRMVAHFNPKMVLKRSRHTFSQYTSLLAQPACLPFPLASSTQYFGAVIGGHQSYQSINRERERGGERYWVGVSSAPSKVKHPRSQASCEKSTRIYQTTIGTYFAGTYSEDAESSGFFVIYVRRFEQENTMAQHR